MSLTIVVSPEAEGDLQRIYDYISEQPGATRALGYVDRILAHCEGFATFPERGRRRDDLRPGLRVTGFERRVTIAFHLMGDHVVIDRIIHAGRNVQAAFDTDDVP